MGISILWKGNEYTPSRDRQGAVPLIIVNHISSRSMSSMDGWYTTPNNKISSAHFGISKHGIIHQYVKIERMAWTQGLTQEGIAKAPAAIVRRKGINPNRYAVSIEHEGMNGHLTAPQFAASIALHRYIQAYVVDQWSALIPFDPEHILGHFHIDPVHKGSCPGAKFPWEHLYSTLSQPENERGEGIEAQFEKLQTIVMDLQVKLDNLEQQQQ